MKKTIQLVALLALMMLPMGVMGQVTIGSDNASNYGGSGEPSFSDGSTGQNGGSGFQSWTWSTSGDSFDAFLSSSILHGHGDINSDGTAFGLFANNSADFISAYRKFTLPLQNGQVFTARMVINFRAGAKGFQLLVDGVGKFLFQATSTSGDKYEYEIGGVFTNTGWAYSASGIYDIRVEQLTSTNATISVTRGGDVITLTDVNIGGRATEVRFFNQNADGDAQNLYFNNLQVTDPGTASLTGTAGWRLLSSPVSGGTYSSLLTNIWTQGATGAGVTNGTPNGTPNVMWSEGSTTNSFNATNVTNLNDVVPLGRGFAVYVYNDDNYTADGGTTWPKTLSITGTENAAGGTYTPAHTSGTQYAIAGNPFASTIAWDAVTKGANVHNAVWVWNPATSTYDAYNDGNGLLAGGLIAPFQGFWIQYDGAASGLTFPASAKSTGGIFRGKEEAPRRMVVRATDNTGSNHAWISFRDGATFGEDRFDAVKFTPLVADYIQTFTMAAAKAHDINTLPAGLTESLEIPLGVTTTRGGSVTLDLTELNLPDGWVASLRDNVAGVTMAVDANFSYTYESSRAKAALVGEAPHVLAATAPRFTLIIDPLNSTSTENGKQTTENFRLEQNYPNPFNPSTVIGFQLAVAGEARLTVYDILGRQVAVLVNGTMSAGAHSVNFDASNLTSGVYMYKLEAGGMSQVRRMTLVK